MYFLFKFFFLFYLFHIIISIQCIEGNFNYIKLNIQNNFQIAGKKEICYKYQLGASKNKISLYFSKINSNTAEVVIYKNIEDISLKEDYYENYDERYKISENIFKEINVKNYGEYVYIIIRDPKNFEIQVSSVILYDSEVPILLQDGHPQTIKYFMSTNIYRFTFNSTKNITFVYSAKVKSKKNITINYNYTQGENIKADVSNQIDNTDVIFYSYKNSPSIGYLTVTVMDIEPGVEDQEFSVIVYAKGIVEYSEIKQYDNISLNYINLDKNDEKQKYYFYYDMNSLNNSNTINFDLDPNSKNNSYINILSGIYHSNKKINADECEKYFNFDKPDFFPIEYDINSDNYKRIYFHDNDTSFPYRYLYIKIEISKLDNYYSPKSMSISIGNEVKVIDLRNIGYYKAETILQKVSSEYPSYFKLLLEPNERYIFYSPFPYNSLYVKGDILIKDETNKKYKVNKVYLENKNEIFFLWNISEFTVRIFGENIFSTTFYVEKYDPGDIIINEYSRNEEPLEIKMEEEYCKNNKRKYILGIYDKESYIKENKKIAKYWTSDEDTMSVYYRSDLVLEGESLFPVADKYKQKEETTIILNNYMDFFTFSCIRNGSIFIRSIYKSFDEVTYKIMFNTISTITIGEDIEILQLTAPIKYVSDYLFFAIMSNDGKKIKIMPDESELFNETTIEGNELFTFKINLKKFKTDQLAIKVNSTDITDIEVISVIRYNSSKYISIANEDMNCLTNNNFVKFIDINTKKIKVIIKGLDNIQVAYGLINLVTYNLEYLPFAYQLKNDIIRKNISNNEIIEINNEFYGKINNNKKYIAFVFSIPNYLSHKYYVQIEEIKDSKNIRNFINNNILLLIIVGSVILLFLIICIIVCIVIKKKKEENKYEMNDDDLLIPQEE